MEGKKLGCQKTFKSILHEWGHMRNNQKTFKKLMFKKTKKKNKLKNGKRKKLKTKIIIFILHKWGYTGTMTGKVLEKFKKIKAKV